MYTYNIYAYSAYKKSSYPFIFFMFYVAALLNCFELLFFPTLIYTPYTIMTKQKKNCHNFVN